MGHHSNENRTTYVSLPITPYASVLDGTKVLADHFGLDVADLERWLNDDDELEELSASVSRGCGASPGTLDLAPGTLNRQAVKTPQSKEGRWNNHAYKPSNAGFC
jgi:hypothetical protein